MTPEERVVALLLRTPFELPRVVHAALEGIGRHRGRTLVAELRLEEAQWALAKAQAEVADAQHEVYNRREEAADA